MEKKEKREKAHGGTCAQAEYISWQGFTTLIFKCLNTVYLFTWGQLVAAAPTLLHLMEKRLFQAATA